MRVHLEQEDTHEKQTYDNLKADQIDINDDAWKMAQKIVRRHYTDEDVEKAYYLQNKFENVSTIAKDSCFHFHYLGTKEDRDYDNNPIIKEANIESHFDFRLNGSLDVDNNSSYSRSDNEYGYALFRDELKAQDDCNPDILIEQEGKENNPHKTKYVDANNKYLGDDDKGYGKEWNEKYQLDLIGRDYCRDRSIACNEDEYMFLIDWKRQKSLFVLAHQNWIKSILNQMKEIKVGLKGYKYLDEALELCTELGLNITDAEIIRTNSTGLTIYNPKNLADRIKGMKNKREKTRAEKIAERIMYEKQQSLN
jgi:formate hydrogenlyase subunit 6/NADH:ubiquinone oxidoreductase subunit I